MLSQLKYSDVSEVMRNFPGGFMQHFLVEKKKIPQRTFFGEVKAQSFRRKRSPPWVSQVLRTATAVGHSPGGWVRVLQNRAEELGCCAHHGDREQREDSGGYAFWTGWSGQALGNAREDQSSGSSPHTTMFWLYNPQQAAQRPWVLVPRSTQRQ